jgi:hypothetical protein
MAGMASNIKMQRAPPNVLYELMGDLAAADLER